MFGNSKKPIGRLAITLIIISLILIVILIIAAYFSYIWFYTEQVNCRCKLGIIPRIVNGQNAPKNFIPYQVSLATAGSNQHFCGGVILNSHWILTASHCLVNMTANSLVVRVGLHELNESDISEKTYRVFKIYSHPSFKASEDVFKVSDLGLIRLFYPIKFVRKSVEPACLNLEERKEYGKEDLIISGWGTTRRSFMENDKLRRFDLSNVLKYAIYVENKKLPCEKNLICVEPRNQGQKKSDSNCHGDSGGPISFTRSGNTTVEGIASFTYPIETKNRIWLCAGPSGYSRLSENKDFIENLVGSNYCGNLN